MIQERKQHWAQIFTLALGIALLPPLWAVVSPYIGVQTGAVALICAGLFVANGSRLENAVKISLGFLLGDVWAVLALSIMEWLPWSANVELYVTLFVLGFAAVILGCLAEKFVFLPAWLCGWAIGLTILAPAGYGAMGTTPLQIGVAMLAGVWYVGVGVDYFQKALLKCLHRKDAEQSTAQSKTEDETPATPATVGAAQHHSEKSTANSNAEQEQP